MTFKCGMDFGTDKSNITYRELTVERSLYPPTSNTPSIQKPDPPTNVSAVCKETSMTVFWRPGFIGGYTQLFKVKILNNQTNQTTSSSFISDQGETEIMKVVFDSLSSKTLYIVYMQAINKLGTVEYVGDVHCTTISAPNSGQSDMISAAGIGAGIGSAVIILVLKSLVVFFYKKRINENKEPNSMYQATENSSEDVVNAEKHIYNELQHVGNDSSVMDHISDETHTYYNECGTMTNIDTEHYQNINRHNEAVI
ncbi:uncharacterized protein LOC143079195 isoform X2 [Mytilus galloprovincialis]|uniref:uncharacterized protein LOC143079195 isoform X2 n=1 Tax=Mytilus galloprovincialis TaxID=29158 RepID=UPI003F7B8ABB